MCQVRRTGRLMLNLQDLQVQPGGVPIKVHWPSGRVVVIPWSSVLFVLGVVPCGIHLLITVICRWLSSSAAEDRGCSRVGAHSQGKCEPCCPGRRSQRHGTSGVRAVLQPTVTLGKPWWGSACDRGPRCQVQEFVLLVRHGDILGGMPT